MRIHLFYREKEYTRGAVVSTSSEDLHLIDFSGLLDGSGMGIPRIKSERSSIPPHLKYVPIFCRNLKSVYVESMEVHS